MQNLKNETSTRPIRKGLNLSSCHFLGPPCKPQPFILVISLAAGSQTSAGKNVGHAAWCLAAHLGMHPLLSSLFTLPLNFLLSRHMSFRQEGSSTLESHIGTGCFYCPHLHLFSKVEPVLDQMFISSSIVEHFSLEFRCIVSASLNSEGFYLYAALEEVDVLLEELILYQGTLTLLSCKVVELGSV